VIDGVYGALIVEFTLPASAYATMALREVTKIDMSPQFQSTLNDAGTSKQQEPESKRIKEDDGQASPTCPTDQ
jgi:tRNA pseudouridine13 synthase